MTKNEYLRLRKQWRLNRDRVVLSILAQAPGLTPEEARSLADKHMGYSPARNRKPAVKGK